MNEMYLVLLAGGIAGLIGALLGGVILYRSRLRTHLALRARVEAERTALQADIAEIDKEELAETEAGKALLRYSEASIQRFGYAREDPMTSLRRQNLDLLNKIEEERKKLAQSEERLAAMAALQQESQKAIENLKKQNEKLWLDHSLKKDVSSANSAQIEKNLRLTLEEVARLQNLLAETNMRLVEVEAERSSPFLQELHQTQSSILQNIDLLLVESVGSLDPMQRNLLETMRASTARLHAVIGDFLQITTRKADSGGSAREAVDLKLIVKDAIEETGSQLRAKRITLNLDLPENLAPIYADRQALAQILARLLSNAGAVSPLQGAVTLRFKIQAEDNKDHLLIQVSDTGGGIPAEDLPGVFTPLYRETDVPVRGVGETGMGLFIAKTLTEAQNGRIWVDTEPGMGSTYNVLIPIARQIPVNMNENK